MSEQPVPADPDARCAPPSDCWLAWEWQVNRQVEAVARLAREEIYKLRADIAARQEEKEITLLIQEDYSTMLRAMARQVTEKRREAAAEYQRYYTYLQFLNYAPIPAIRAWRQRLVQAWQDGAGTPELDWDLSIALSKANPTDYATESDVPVPATERALDAALATIQRLEARLAEARVENDELRSLCVDELSREGQAMGLDDRGAPEPEVSQCPIQTDTPEPPDLDEWRATVIDALEKCEDTYEALGQSLGMASMCWEHVGRAGVFQSSRAGVIVDELYRHIQLTRSYAPSSPPPDVRAEVALDVLRDWLNLDSARDLTTDQWLAKHDEIKATARALLTGPALAEEADRG